MTKDRKELRDCAWGKKGDWCLGSIERSRVL